jgi:hypothetical protein
VSGVKTTKNGKLLYKESFEKDAEINATFATNATTKKKTDHRPKR